MSSVRGGQAFRIYYSQNQRCQPHRASPAIHAHCSVPVQSEILKLTGQRQQCKDSHVVKKPGSPYEPPTQVATACKALQWAGLLAVSTLALTGLSFSVLADDQGAAAGYTPSPYSPGWEVWVGFAAGVIPFLIGGYEFTKRIGWGRFFTSTATPGNGGPLMAPKGQSSVFYKVSSDTNREDRGDLLEDGQVDKAVERSPTSR